MKKNIFIGFLVIGSALSAATRPSGSLERAHRLQTYINRERPAYTLRESQKQSLTDELDELNADQNRVRVRLLELESGTQELLMSRDNLSLEYKKQKELEALERKRLVSLFKVAHRIKREGLLPFLFCRDDSSSMANRIRVLYRTLRSQSLVAHQLSARAQRLESCGERLHAAQMELEKRSVQLDEEQDVLAELLGKKKELIATISAKQNHYQAALRQYKQVSRELAALFDDFESNRDDSPQTSLLRRGSIPIPLVAGRLVKTFGKAVNHKYHTITYQKGIEIEVPQNTPVKSVLAGRVEFEGWVRGLGNVVIIHHGGGFYTLSGHLFKTLKTRGLDVSEGEVIGLVGDTGENTTPSLYFEMREKNRAVDPTLYFIPSQLQLLKSQLG